MAISEVTHEQAADRIEKYFREGRLLRHEWMSGERTGNGYERACLLVAAVPEVGYGNYSACPASLMPAWMVHLTPWLDDAPSEEAWPEIVSEYAWCLRRSGVLTQEAWRRLDYRCRLVAIDESRTHAGTTKAVLSAIDGVRDLLARAIGGEVVEDGEWATAREAAAGAAEWAAADRAARASAWAAAREESADRIAWGILAAWRDEIEKATKQEERR